MLFDTSPKESTEVEKAFESQPENRVDNVAAEIGATSYRATVLNRNCRSNPGRIDDGRSVGLRRDGRFVPLCVSAVQKDVKRDDGSTYRDKGLGFKSEGCRLELPRRKDAEENLV